MMWRSVACSAASILLAGLVWVLSPHPLEWIGLEAFDPLDRICLVIVLLSAGEAIAARLTAGADAQAAMHRSEAGDVQ